MAVAAQQAAQRRGRHEPIACVGWSGRAWPQVATTGRCRSRPSAMSNSRTTCSCASSSGRTLSPAHASISYGGAATTVGSGGQANDDRGDSRQAAGRSLQAACLQTDDCTNDIPWNYESWPTSPRGWGNLIDQITADAPKALVVVAQIGPSKRRRQNRSHQGVQRRNPRPWCRRASPPVST